MAFKARFAPHSPRLYSPDVGEHGVGYSVHPMPGDGSGSDYWDDYTEDTGIYSSPSPAERRMHASYDMLSAKDYAEMDCYEDYPTHANSTHHFGQRGQSTFIDSPTEEPGSWPYISQTGSHRVIADTHPCNYDQEIYYDSRREMSLSRSLHSSSNMHEGGGYGGSSIANRGSNPRNAQGIPLRPVSTLPDMYRGLFKFGVFNAVQSSCFDDVFNSNENLVISAPTGSGKTVLFELAIIRMLAESKATDGSLKCVYVAPTKALCSERYRDWTAKFDPLGIKCAEMTGDTVHFGRGVWGDAKKASVIITTGEKWDSLTRNWKDHSQILSRIQLFLIDEVHILNESRGSTLEVVVSRMKTRGSCVRFVLVSATVPNIHDIASWVGAFGRPHVPAKVFEFGEDFRPCKLTRFVIGIYRQEGQNDFVFSKNLDYKLFAALQQHSVGKPILVFCSTRKGVFTTAEQLMKDYIDAQKSKQHLPWSHPRRIEQSFNDKRLLEFASFGIGVHHAGLSLDDRRTTEDLYLKGVLRIVVATSTLAVGINLPAHMVVIKGVQTFQNNASVEYSDLDVMQMLGRAGRPQFDRDGIALILCEESLENKYRALVQGKTILESSLHTNLAEHLNSEIALGTITSISNAKRWLRGTFLFQRIRKNPNHYRLGKDVDQTWEARVDDLVMESVEQLRQTQLVEAPAEGAEGEELVSTDYGDIMSKLYIRRSTMSLILALPDRPSLRELLEMISSSEEFSESKLRASEKTALSKLRRHPDIRFEIKKLEKTADKVFLLIQAILGGISLNAPEYKSADSQPQLEAFGIFRHVGRIARAIVEVGVYRKLGAQVKYGLELMRCLTARAWEDRPVVLRQLEQIGEKSIKVLAEHGITSIAKLLEQDAIQLETLLNRRTPFGLELLASARDMPQYFLNISELSLSSNGGKDPVEVELSVECGLRERQGGQVSSKAKQKGRNLDMTVVLTLSSDMELIDYRRISTRSLNEKKSFTVTAELTRPSQSITVHITSENVAGLVVMEVYKPALSPKEFPTLNTRPLTAIDIDLAGLEEDPDFWDMDIEEKIEELPQVRDLTKPTARLEDRGTSLLRNGKGLQGLARIESTPKRMPNGNSECHHPCKDKSKCRHLCCREGLPEKPKKRGSAGKQRQDSPKRPAARTAAQTRPKTASRKTPDRRLEELESLHARSSVTANLRLSPESRLKVDSPTKLKRTRKAIPDFNIMFTELRENTEAVKTTGYDSTEIEDDDDLPEASDIPPAPPDTKSWTPPSETNYSNSDIDSLIRAVPLDNIDISTRPNEDIQGNKKQRKFTLKLTPSPGRKRHRAVRAGSISPPRKRRRSLERLPAKESKPSPSQSANTVQFQDSPLQSNIIDTHQALFLPDSSDEALNNHDDQEPTDGWTGPCLLEDSVVSIGSAYLNIQTTTPDLTLSTNTVSTSAVSGLGDEKPSDLENALHTVDDIQDVLTTLDDEGPAEELDEFEELDAWLNSAAVEIV
ncbi:putative sec63 Brl domain containing protein [Lyophyllum shimeji]|uniref:DNA 3'-5' helicase n=1 Tax=Lyophyllum shimeji TaxID=47721 RepID=A0A9P3UKS0_LYOSH|nr:putative sec63 Brl domain containing protein [Lyophyllum shimeji]